MSDTISLELFEDGSAISAATTSATVPIGVTNYVYRAQLDAETSIQCGFSASVRNGFFIEVDNMDMRVTDDSALAYLVSSPGLSDAARLPSFESALDTSFFIGFRTSTGRPFTVSVPEGYNTTLNIALRWCSDLNTFPSHKPISAHDANTHVSLAGFQSTGPAPKFAASADASWVLDSASRT